MTPFNAANDGAEATFSGLFQGGNTFHTGGVRCSNHLSPTMSFQSLKQKPAKYAKVQVNQEGQNNDL